MSRAAHRHSDRLGGNEVERRTICSFTTLENNSLSLAYDKPPVHQSQSTAVAVMIQYTKMHILKPTGLLCVRSAGYLDSEIDWTNRRGLDRRGPRCCLLQLCRRPTWEYAAWTCVARSWPGARTFHWRTSPAALHVPSPCKTSSCTLNANKQQ